jgi:hypothetical protein
MTWKAEELPLTLEPFLNRGFGNVGLTELPQYHALIYVYEY